MPSTSREPYRKASSPARLCSFWRRFFPCAAWQVGQYRGSTLPRLSIFASSIDEADKHVTVKSKSTVTLSFKFATAGAVSLVSPVATTVYNWLKYLLSGQCLNVIPVQLERVEGRVAVFKFSRRTAAQNLSQADRNGMQLNLI